MAEAVIIIPVFILIWGSVNYLAATYRDHVQVRQDLRAYVWRRAAVYSCYQEAMDAAPQGTDSGRAVAIATLGDDEKPTSGDFEAEEALDLFLGPAVPLSNLKAAMNPDPGGDNYFGEAHRGTLSGTITRPLSFFASLYPEVATSAATATYDETMPVPCNETVAGRRWGNMATCRVPSGEEDAFDFCEVAPHAPGCDTEATTDGGALPVLCDDLWYVFVSVASQLNAAQLNPCCEQSCEGGSCTNISNCLAGYCDETSASTARGYCEEDLVQCYTDRYRDNGDLGPGMTCNRLWCETHEDEHGAEYEYECSQCPKGRNDEDGVI